MVTFYVAHTRRTYRENNRPNNTSRLVLFFELVDVSAYVQQEDEEEDLQTRTGRRARERERQCAHEVAVVKEEGGIVCYSLMKNKKKKLTNLFSL